jgi:hypothetical protein
VIIDVGGHSYDERDAGGTLAALGAWWEQLSRGRELPTSFGLLLDEQVVALTRFIQVDSEAASLDAVDRLGDQAAALVRRGADSAVVLSTSLRLIGLAGEALRAAGALPATNDGVVAQLSSSDGGVPKRAVNHVVIDRTGVVGDRQQHRVHHGRPWQALCLWSAEVVDAFAAEGHPIGYGSAGENITVRGIPWGQVQAGVRLRIGEVLCEAAVWSLPCRSNARWFIGGEFSVMHHDRGPVSRIYATVLEAGTVRTGDIVTLEP